MEWVIALTWVPAKAGVALLEDFRVWRNGWYIVISNLGSVESWLKGDKVGRWVGLIEVL